MATVALRRLAGARRLPDGVVVDLVRLASDDALEDYCRTAALDAFRFMDSSIVSCHRQTLRSLGQSKSPADRHFTAMAVLARHGWLQDLDATTLERSLG